MYSQYARQRLIQFINTHNQKFNIDLPYTAYEFVDENTLSKDDDDNSAIIVGQLLPLKEDRSL